MTPVHPKVKASSAAAAVAGVIVYFLGRYVLHGNVDPVIQAEIFAALPGVLTFAAGWVTPGRHLSLTMTHREVLPSLPEPLAAPAEKLTPPAK